MPLTPFQREVAHLLAAHRNPDSPVARGAVINRSDASPRFSADLDLFHDAADQVHSTALADAATLLAHGLVVEWLLQQPALHRAGVSRGVEHLKREWCCDSSFRFFPVQPDPDFDYCLHLADLATNKALALAGGSELRDFIDILYLHEHYLPLGAICWAACGKDQGFTPWSLLDQARRNAKFREVDLVSGYLAHPVTLPALKQRWLAAAAAAEDLFAQLPAHEVGCLYLDAAGSPVAPDPHSGAFASLLRHFGSVRGAWPRLS